MCSGRGWSQRDGSHLHPPPLCQASQSELLPNMNAQGSRVDDHPIQGLHKGKLTWALSLMSFRDLSPEPILYCCCSDPDSNKILCLLLWSTTVDGSPTPGLPGPPRGVTDATHQQMQSILALNQSKESMIFCIIAIYMPSYATSLLGWLDPHGWFCLYPLPSILIPQDSNPVPKTPWPGQLHQPTYSTSPPTARTPLPKG